MLILLVFLMFSFLCNLSVQFTHTKFCVLLYRVCQKFSSKFDCYNFDKRGPIFIIFSLLNSEKIYVGRWNTNYHLPSNLLLHYLVKSKWSTVQLYSTVSSVQSDEKCFVAVNVHEECYVFVFLHWRISVIYLKCPPSAHVCILSRECHCSMDASILHCSMPCQIFFFIN